MLKYHLYINGKMQLSDYSNIYDYLQFINKDDQLIVSINTENKMDLNIILTILRNNNFNMINQGGMNNERLYVKGDKKIESY